MANGFLTRGQVDQEETEAQRRRREENERRAQRMVEQQRRISAGEPLAPSPPQPGVLGQAGRFAGGVATGLGEFVTDTGAGIAALGRIGAGGLARATQYAPTPQSQFTSAVASLIESKAAVVQQGLAEHTEELMEARRTLFPGLAGGIGEFGGRIGGDIAAIAATGGAAGALSRTGTAARYLPTAAKLARVTPATARAMGVPRAVARVAPAARGIVASTPLAITQAVGGTQASSLAALEHTFNIDVPGLDADNPRDRAIFEAAMDVGLGTVIEWGLKPVLRGAGRGLRGLPVLPERGAREAGRAAEEALGEPRAPGRLADLQPKEVRQRLAAQRELKLAREQGLAPRPRRPLGGLAEAERAARAAPEVPKVPKVEERAVTGYRSAKRKSLGADSDRVIKETKQIELELDEVAPRVQTAEQRATRIRGPKYRAGASLYNRTLPTPNVANTESRRALARMLGAYRNPKYEQSHVLILDKNGRIISHEAVSSGAIDYVAHVNRDLFDVDARGRVFGNLARRLDRMPDAESVMFAHNHPSGAVYQSEGDMRMIEKLALGMELYSTARGRHVRFAGQLVIDSEQASFGWWDDAARTVRTKIEKIEVRQRGQNWLDPKQPTVSTPQQVAELVAPYVRNSDPHTVQVVYLSTQNNVVAIEPHSADSIERIGTWFGQRSRGLGAFSAVLVTGDTKSFIDTTGHALRMGPGNFVDIIHVRPDGSGFRSGADEGFTFLRAAAGPGGPQIAPLKGDPSTVIRRTVQSMPPNIFVRGTRTAAGLTLTAQDSALMRGIRAGDSFRKLAKDLGFANANDARRRAVTILGAAGMEGRPDTMGGVRVLEAKAAERLVGAAVRLSDKARRLLKLDDRIVTGSAHPAIRQQLNKQAKQLGVDVRAINAGMEDGFQTTRQPFVSRLEAGDIAAAARQGRPMELPSGRRAITTERAGLRAAPGIERRIEREEGALIARRVGQVPTEAKSELIVPRMNELPEENVREVNDLVNGELLTGLPGDRVARAAGIDAPARSIEGMGVFNGKLTPNTVIRGRTGTALVERGDELVDEWAEKYAAASAVAQGQNAAVWLREVPKSVADRVTNGGPGYNLQVTRQRYRQLNKIISDNPRFAALDGSTFVENEAIFRNFGDVPEAEYLRLLQEAVREMPGGVLGARELYYVGGYLDGPAAFNQVFKGSEALQRVADLLGSRTGPIYRQLADRLQEAGAEARIQDYLQAFRGVVARRGFAQREVTEALAGAGIGALAGAAAAPERERVTGAVAGAAAGAGVGLLARRLRPRARPKAAAAPPPGRARQRPRPHARPVGQPKGRPSKVQLNKFGLSRQGQAKINAEKTRLEVGQAAEIPPRKVSHREQMAVARSLGMEDIERAHLNDQMDGTTLLAIRNVYRTNEEALVRAYTDLKRITHGPPPTEVSRRTVGDVSRLQAQVAAIEGEQAALLKTFIPKASQFGRDLNSLKIMARRSLGPESSFQWIVRAQRLAGRDLLPDERLQILKFLQRRDRPGLIGFMGKLIPPTRTLSLAGFNQVRRAGLLTGLRTQARNFLSNTGELTMRTVDNPAAALADRVASRITGKRTIVTVNPLSRVRASARGAARSFGRNGTMMQAMRGQMDRGMLTKLDLHREVNLDNRFADAYVKFMFRLQGAADQPFRQAAFMESLFEQARTMGVNRGLRGKALTDFTEATVRGSLKSELGALPDDMVLQAIIDSEEAVFQNPSLFGSIVSGARARARQLGARPGVAGQAGRLGEQVITFVVPFSNTPGAVLGRLIERTPVGMLGSMAGMAQLAKAADNGIDERVLLLMQRDLAKRFGRSATGTIAILLGMHFANKGLASGRWPETTSEARDWLQEGKPEDAVLVRLPGEDKARWRQLTGISPIGNLIAIGAQLTLDSAKDDYRPADTISFAESAKRMAETLKFSVKPAGQLAAAETAGRTILEQSFLRGVNDVIQLFSRGRGGRTKQQVGARIAGSVVPIIVQDFARAIDPVIRRPQTLGEGIKSRVPFWSLTVPARLDPLGRVMVPEPETRATRVFDPFLSRAPLAERDPQGYLRAFERTGFTVPGMKKQSGETDAAFRERQIKYGEETREALDLLLQNRVYQRADTETQKEMLGQTVRRVRGEMTRRGEPKSWRAIVSAAIRSAR